MINDGFRETINIVNQGYTEFQFFGKFTQIKILVIQKI